MAGRVLDAQGQALSGADLRIYSLASGNSTCAAQDYTCLAPPRLIAEGTVQGDGSVDVLLPAAKR